MFLLFQNSAPSVEEMSLPPVDSELGKPASCRDVVGLVFLCYAFVVCLEPREYV